MKTIISAHNEQLKHLAKLLTQSKTRLQHRQAVLEGVHLLQTYLQSGALPEQVYLSPTRAAHPEAAELLAQLPPEKITLVEGEALAKITSLTEADDVMSLIALPEAKPLPQSGDCVVLAGVQDPGNAGTIIRSAAAAGVKQMIVGSGSVDIWSPKVLRASMGAVFLAEIHTRADIADWLCSYRDTVWATALREQHQVSLYQADLRVPSAWIFGNEGSGIAPEILAKVPFAVRIPMAEGTESLNVAMAATVCLFEQMRQRLQ
ncbi:RNA methyltransferase [Neisseria sp. ZJ106]|uniref:RNA methyltransferase n=1 Tax=Neisseria lisongii TaxID=2912188 RepID=A0ABY7RK07_9NEIS|nr:RNA methyltransferase [Neisseria lisongii]MCF7522069.1 RNA methyltransferase [Neisseria lisongii]WCL71866.1 RNA methyltransferase [Neisseria lisongii]